MFKKINRINKMINKMIKIFKNMKQIIIKLNYLPKNSRILIYNSNYNIFL